MSDHERLKGAECLMTALFESLTTDGCSFGRVCYRFCELAGLDMKVHPVRSALHYAGGLTVNNFLAGGMMEPMGQNLGGAESREAVLAAEVKRLESQIQDVLSLAKKTLHNHRYDESRMKDELIDGLLCRIIQRIEGGAT